MDKLLLFFSMCVFFYSTEAKCNCSLQLVTDVLRNSSLMERDVTENKIGKEFAYEYVDSDILTSTTMDNDTEEYIKEIHAPNESLLELNETEFRSLEPNEACPQYKVVPELAVHKMANIWEVAYYKSSKLHVTCFRMYIQRVSIEKRKFYKNRYSTFNGSINWEECHLEIITITNIDKSSKIKRKHFLQGGAINSEAILDNIIITETTENATKIITLEDESPNQWMTFKNLLLVRDCELGTVVVFTKVSTKANLMDVKHAFRIFGEDNTADKMSCVDDENYNENDRYNILS